MDHSWRPRPLQGNLCPTCSIPHFPFCPPPPHHHPIPFNQNPSFFPHTTPSSFQRPSFDPFLDHPGSNANLRRSFDDRFVDPRPWHRNPSLEFADGFAPRFDDHGGTGFKRMRVDENLMDPPRISMDHERRLKLIRDHGGVSGADVDHENGGYFRENSVFDRSFGGVDELRGGKNGMQLKPPSNYEMSDFRDPRFGSDFDREGSYFRSEPDFKTREHGSVFGQDSRSYRNEEIGQSQYGLANGHSRQGSDVETLYNEGGLRRQSNVSDSYSRIVDYPNDEFPSKNYSSLSGKEPWYSPPTGWHELSGSSARHHEKRSSFSTDNRDHNHHLAQPYAMNHDIHFHGQLDERSGNQGPVGYQNLPMATPPPRVVNVQPPLPASPPPPLPMDPPGHPLYEPRALHSPAMTSPSLFPIAVSSAATVPSSYAPIPQAHSLGRPYFHDKSHLHASTGFATEEFQNINRVYSAKYLGQDQPLPQRSSDKPKAVDASHIFKQPHRATRPDHRVIILRGLPGSGKSYLAKLLRDLEVENGGDAPRIHSMDDYFMTEVEKAEESDFSKSSITVRGKKPIMKKVMEYCYEPEMEEAYRSSMLKAFKKTLDEGVFTLVIVDDRNLRVADFAQFWATAKRSGYEVYLVEAPYKDPVGCAARNVHGFTKDDIEKMAGRWEEAPSLYLKLDIKSLFQGDDLKESGIQEVDMDTEDGDSAGTLPGLEERNSEITVLPLRDHSPNGSSKDDKKWDVEGEHLGEEVKELGRSKWSDDLDDGTAKRTEATKGNLNALSGLVKAYSKEGKSVHWGDQVGNTGFSIGAARKVNVSLVIGPGAGYNMKSNPLPEEQVSTRNNGESEGQSVFQERIRAERESFRVVFDKRRQRIRGLGLEEE